MSVTPTSQGYILASAAAAEWPTSVSHRDVAPRCQNVLSLSSAGNDVFLPSSPSAASSVSSSCVDDELDATPPSRSLPAARHAEVVVATADAFAARLLPSVSDDVSVVLAAAAEHQRLLKCVSARAQEIKARLVSVRADVAARLELNVHDVPKHLGCVGIFDGLEFVGIAFQSSGVVFELLREHVPAHRWNNAAFLYHLHRRFGNARSSAVDVSDLSSHNGVLAEAASRPQKTLAAENEGFHELGPLARVVCNALRHRGHVAFATACEAFVVADVVIPTMRCDAKHLSKTIRTCLEAERTRSLRFNLEVFVTVDDPTQGPALIRQLAAILSDTDDGKSGDGWIRRLHFRVNTVNEGASVTRNVGLLRSWADWTLFYDDDVNVLPGVSIPGYIEAIRLEEARGARTAAGFVGDTQIGELPPATGRQRAVYLSGSAFFWRVALRSDTLPFPAWGVTANVCLRHLPDVVFDPTFRGGEDVDYCIEVQKAAGLPLLPCPAAHAVHPFWNDGHPHLTRFSGWAYGDGRLLDKHIVGGWSYLTAPNVIEWLALLTVGVFPFVLLIVPVAALAAVVLATFAASFVFELVDQLWHYGARSFMYVEAGEPPLWNLLLVVAPHTFLVRCWSDGGRLLGHWHRGAVASNVCRRFRWEGPDVRHAHLVVSDQRWHAFRLAVCVVASAVSAWMMIVV